MTFKIFQAWKVMESGLNAGKSWKVKQMVVTFFNRVHFLRPLHTLSLSNVVNTSARLTMHSVYVFTIVVS